MTVVKMSGQLVRKQDLIHTNMIERLKKCPLIAELMQKQ